MVGVPGRSKGCLTCRERRIKCDLGKPSCERCLKSHRKCIGYNREATFVHFDANDEKPSATYKPKSQKKGSRADIGDLGKVARTYTKDATSTSKGGLLLYQAPTGNALNREQFLSLFLDTFLPQDNHGGLDYGLSWARHVPFAGHTSEALSAALTAVSTATVGKGFGDDRLVKVSQQMYGQALASLRKALLNKKTAGTSDTLGATIALSNYELIVPSGANNIAGWVAHVQGAARIIHSGNYHYDQSSMEKALLIHVKTNCLFDALSRRKATFMADERWRTKLLEDDMPDQLRNVIIDIPFILEETDKVFNGFSATGTLDLETSHTLLTLCKAVDLRLKQWHTRAWKESDIKLYWPTIKTKTEAEIPKGSNLFAEDLSFPSLPEAQMLMAYWYSRSLVYATMEQILRAIQEYQLRHFSNLLGLSAFGEATQSISLSTETNTSALPAHIERFKANAVKFADMICRSVAFCIDPIHRQMGLQATTQPLWLAQQIYRPRDKVKMSWCLQASKTIASRGLGMMERISLDFSLEDYADSAKPDATGG